ncbi:MAG: hypothetical protein AAGI90_03420 [Chlamydiota bacterium]
MALQVVFEPGKPMDFSNMQSPPVYLTTFLKDLPIGREVSVIQGTLTGAVELGGFYAIAGFITGVVENFVKGAASIWATSTIWSYVLASGTVGICIGGATGYDSSKREQLNRDDANRINKVNQARYRQFQRLSNTVIDQFRNCSYIIEAYLQFPRFINQDSADKFFCPITESVLCDPVVMEGCECKNNAFERQALEKYIGRHNGTKCPMCKTVSETGVVKISFRTRAKVSQLLKGILRAVGSTPAVVPPSLQESADDIRLIIENVANLMQERSKIVESISKRVLFRQSREEGKPGDESVWECKVNAVSRWFESVKILD